MKAWHFLSKDCRLRGQGPLVEPGSVFEVDPERLELCRYGLHGSIRPLYALKYAPGPVVCRTVHTGKIIRGGDKLCSSRREVLWMYDATDVLRHFARLCALDVVHLWDPPKVVLRYLQTGDEEIREVARVAAWEAAGDTWAAASDAATAASRAVASDVVSAAVWTVSAATNAAAWETASASAARERQNRRLCRMLMEGRKR